MTKPKRTRRNRFIVMVELPKGVTAEIMKDRIEIALRVTMLDLGDDSVRVYVRPKKKRKKPRTDKDEYVAALQERNKSDRETL